MVQRNNYEIYEGGIHCRDYKRLIIWKPSAHVRCSMLSRHRIFDCLETARLLSTPQPKTRMIGGRSIIAALVGALALCVERASAHATSGAGPFSGARTVFAAAHSRRLERTHMMTVWFARMYTWYYYYCCMMHPRNRGEHCLQQARVATARACIALPTSSRYTPHWVSLVAPAMCTRCPVGLFVRYRSQSHESYHMMVSDTR